MFSKRMGKSKYHPSSIKGDKQRIKNYRPVSLLPIRSKIFEKMIFKSPFKYLDDNKLLTCNKSGFQPGI